MIHFIIYAAVWIVIGCIIANTFDKIENAPNKLAVLLVIVGWPVPVAVMLFYFLRLRLSGRTR